MNSSELKKLVKECVLEVLQESLLEGFDPLSQGPNMVDPTGENNPYPIWNAQMRKLEEGDGTNIKLTRIGDDDFSRPLYTDENGRQYVDVNMGRGNPSIHTTTDAGEPEIPVQNYTIISNFSKQTFPNALCPRCKTSNPKHIITHPNGEKECVVCHNGWADVTENEHGRYAQKAGAGQFDQRTFRVK